MLAQRGIQTPISKWATMWARLLENKRRAKRQVVSADAKTLAAAPSGCSRRPEGHSLPFELTWQQPLAETKPG